MTTRRQFLILLGVGATATLIPRPPLLPDPAAQAAALLLGDALRAALDDFARYVDRVSRVGVSFSPEQLTLIRCMAPYEPDAIDSPAK